MNSSYANANERVVKNYLKGLEDKLVKMMKTKPGKINEESILDLMF